MLIIIYNVYHNIERGDKHGTDQRKYSDGRRAEAAVRGLLRGHGDEHDHRLLRIREESGAGVPHPLRDRSGDTQRGDPEGDGRSPADEGGPKLGEELHRC